MPYIQRLAPRHAQGAVILDTGEVRDTVMCAHCQMHWVPEPGSGHKRGWCFKCQAHLCGKQACMAGCRPWEQQIEAMERGR